MFLIAEDDPDDQFLIQSVADEVCHTDFQMHFVWDGIELLDFLHKKIDHHPRPSLIMLDLNMPRKDGREALKEIKMHPELASISMVILTTSSREDDFLYCQSFGIEGYYRKPGSIYELREIIGKLCNDYLS